MVSTSLPVIVVSYGGREERLTLSVRPCLELSDAEADQAADYVWNSLKKMFSLPPDAELTLHETESGRTMSKESFRDPSYLLRFPKFWYLTLESAPVLGFHSLDVEEVPATDSSDLIDLFDIQDLSHSDIDEGDMYPSLLELSMDHNSPALGSPCDDLIPITTSCNELGDFGIVLRHFTVLANIPQSEHSGSEGGSRADSRCSMHSSESHDTLRMSTVFIHQISPGSPAESSGLQIGDIVYSINGQSVNKYSVEEIQMLFSENDHELVLWVSPDRQDDLLFLYPQYVHGEPGEYERSVNEKILVADIEARVQQPLMGMEETGTVTSEPSINLQPFSPLHVRSASADDRFLCATETYLYDNSCDSFQQLALPVENNSTVSIDSEHQNGLSSSTDDLLITGCLADIPVEASPSTLKRLAKSDLTALGLSHHHLGESCSLDSLPGADHEEIESMPEWFPNSVDMGLLESFPTDGSFSGDTPVNADVNHVFSPVAGGKSKIAKFKQTLKNLAGSSTEHKDRKSTCLTVNHTSSTSALDRIKVNSTQGSFMAPAQRSFSTELGNIQLQRPQQLPLQFLHRVSSAQNASPTISSEIGHRNHQAKLESDVLISKPPLILPSDVQQMSPAKSSQGSDISDSSYSSFFHLSQEHGRHTSGESIGMSMSRGRHRDRSYRSQRQKLHKRSNVMSRGSSSEDVGSTSIPASHNSLVCKKPLLRKPYRAALSSQPLPFNRHKNYLLDEEVVSSPPSHDSLDFIPHSSHAPEYPSVSHTSVCRTASLGESFSKDSGTNNKQLLSPNIKISNAQPSATDEELSKLKHIRRTIPATSSSVKRKVDHSLRQTESYHKRSEELLATSTRPLTDPSILQSPKADFHGPVHKKQLREGGKKAQDRSWRPLYAAIQGHHLMFYENADDARNGIPLSLEPSLDLHQCMMAYHSSKQRAFVFGLTLPGDSECLIQAESEESMLMWTRIIRNLNRWHRRMPSSGLSMQREIHRSQELSRSKLQAMEKKQSQERSRTPQPSMKKEEQSKTHFRKIIQRLRANNKDTSYNIDSSYITFGVPLEDCPASTENKRIPLLLSVCVEEIEKNWLDTEGLYRVAGPIKQVKALCMELDKGNYRLLQGHNDAHTITSTLKKFLKELPDPVIPNDCYNDFVCCGREAHKEGSVKRLQELVDELPVVHFHTLAFLIKHLKKVETLSKKNKMDQNNLCLVFGPTVIRKADDTGLVCDMKACYKVMEFFMVHCNTFFKRFFDTYDQRERRSMSAFEKRNALRRGVSDPSQPLEDIYGARSQTRRSWDGSARIFSQGSQSYDASILSGELGASQSRSKSHLKPRLGWTRQVLTNQSPEDSPTEHTNVVERNATLISPTTSYPVTKASVSRKISYSEAMQHGRMFMDPLAEDNLSHLPANVTGMGGQYPRRFSSIPSHSRLHQSGLHRYSLDNRRDTETVGKLDPIPYWSPAEYPSRSKN